MDKFAEQINRDIYTLAMYKLANWSKIAEGEPRPDSDYIRDLKAERDYPSFFDGLPMDIDHGSDALQYLLEDYNKRSQPQPLREAFPQHFEQGPQQGPRQEPEPYPANIREMNPRRAAEALDFENKVYSTMTTPDFGDLPYNIDWKTTSTSPVTGGLQSMPQRYAETAMESASGMKLPRNRRVITNPGEAPARYTYPLDTQYHRLEDEPYGQGFHDDISQQQQYDNFNSVVRYAPNPGKALRQQQNFYLRGSSPYNYPRE